MRGHAVLPVPSAEGRRGSSDANVGRHGQDAPFPAPSTGQGLPRRGCRQLWQMKTCLRRGKSKVSFSFCLRTSPRHLGGEGGRPVWLRLPSHGALSHRRALF